MKKTAEKGKKIVLGVLLVLACILMPQKMTNAAGNTVPYGIFKKQGKYGRNRQRIYAGSL